MGVEGVSASIGMQPMFQEGDQVEYWSETYSMFMDAVVTKINLSEGGVSSYDLDVKSKAQPNRIRSPPEQANPQINKSIGEAAVSLSAPSAKEDFAAHGFAEVPPGMAPTYQVGDDVEYYSMTHHQWMQAKVLKVNPGSDTYDLDVKKGAQGKRMRYLMQNSPPEVQPPLSASPEVPLAMSSDPRLAMLAAAMRSQMGPPMQPSTMLPAQALKLAVSHQPSSTVQPSVQLGTHMRNAATRGVSPASGRIGLQLPVAAVSTSAGSSLPAGAQVVHVAVGSPTRKCQAGYSPAHSPEVVVAHAQKPSIGLPVQSRSSSPQRPKGSTTPPHPLAAGAKHISRRSLPGPSASSSAWPSLLVGGRDVNQQECTSMAMCSAGHAVPSAVADPRQAPAPQLRARSAVAICTPSGAGRLLEFAELQLGAESFHPQRAAVRSQLLAKLGLPANSAITEMQGFRGGLNEGVWFIKSGVEDFVLKLVRCNRIAQNVLTEAENLMRISREHPQTMHDPCVAFPFKIFSCLGMGGAKKNDLIVMRKVRGERLAEWIARKWYGKQTPQLLQVFEAIGARLAEFHARYGNAQHGDFQPSNIFYDEDHDEIFFIDVGGMGVPTMETDAEHFKKSLVLLADTYGQQLAVDGCHRFELGYQRAA